MRKHVISRALVLGLLLGGAFGVAGAQVDAPQDELAARIDLRIREWQPTAAEKRFDDIGWASDIREAIQLGRQAGRPVFLFTHDGRINTGRC